MSVFDVLLKFKDEPLHDCIDLYLELFNHIRGRGYHEYRSSGILILIDQCSADRMNGIDQNITLCIITNYNVIVLLEFYDYIFDNSCPNIRDHIDYYAMYYDDYMYNTLNSEFMSLNGCWYYREHYIENSVRDYEGAVTFSMFIPKLTKSSRSRR